jgi:formylglycine-generating enzyme required for sulfatase activity
MKEMVLIILTLMLPMAIRSTAHAAAPNIEKVLVKGGCFQMGDTFGDGGKDEKPVHEVCVSDFYIGKYEVTQAQWVSIMEKNPSTFTGDHRPVEQVSWNDVQEFILKLSAESGLAYRLPTEAEWEYAARSGGKREKWAGVSDKSRLADYAWYDANSGEKTHVVGIKKPNVLGIYDMSGNVSEWVQDRYGDLYYEESPRDNPQGPMAGSIRVLRGSSWYSTPKAFRASLRSGSSPSSRYSYLGFRLVLPAVGEPSQSEARRKKGANP